jgi:hypothetical protein
MGAQSQHGRFSPSSKAFFVEREAGSEGEQSWHPRVLAGWGRGGKPRSENDCKKLKRPFFRSEFQAQSFLGREKGNFFLSMLTEAGGLR